MGLLITKGEAIKMIGIGRGLFAMIEPDLPYVKINRRKFYKPRDVELRIEKLRETPCTHHQSKTKKTRTISIPHSQFLGLDAFEEAVAQTTKGKQASTH
jgi:hypothetical protein